MDNLFKHGVDKEFSISEDCHVGCNLAGRVGIINEKGEIFLSLNRKMSATALKANDCSFWVL